MLFSPVDEARKFTFIREAGQNTGLMVESIQHWSGGRQGESWCAYFVLFILDICFGGKLINPIVRSGSVEVIYNQAKAQGWLTNTPVKDDLGILINDMDHAHHIFFVTETGGTIAGNTSADGTSDNGDRVAEHALHANPAHIKYIHYPR